MDWGAFPLLFPLPSFVPPPQHDQRSSHGGGSGPSHGARCLTPAHNQDWGRSEVLRLALVFSMTVLSIIKWHFQSSHSHCFKGWNLWFESNGHQPHKMATSLIKWALLLPQTFSRLAKSPRPLWRVKCPRQKRIEFTQHHKNTQWPFSFSSNSHAEQGFFGHDLLSPHHVYFPASTCIGLHTNPTRPCLPSLASTSDVNLDLLQPCQSQSVFSWILKNQVNPEFVYRY